MGAWWIATTLTPHPFQAIVDPAADKSDPFTGLGACAEYEAPVTDFDAFICPDSSVTGSYLSDQQRDSKDIVDGLLSAPPSASLGSFLSGRLMRQVKPKLVEDNDYYTKPDIVMW